MKKILFLLSFLFVGLSAFADAYDENGNLMDPPGEDRTFELYAWVRGDYEYGRKYYETHVRFDGTDVYFKDICPTANTGSWVKGSYIDENTIRILPQKYFTEMTDVGPYTTHLVMWHGKKVGYDQAGTQYDHYDLIVGEDANGNMTLTYADVDDWVSVADVPMQGIYDFASELRYTAIKNDYSTDIITEQPAGQRQRYSFMANVYSNDDNDFWADFGYKADIVWGEDGNVYFSTLTPDNPEATGWIKGEYDKDSRIITVPSFQCVGYMEDYDTYTYLANYDWDNQTTLDTPLSFQVDERGWIFATDEAEEQYPATIYRQGSITKGLTAINQYLTMMPVAEEPVEAPEDVQLRNYTLSYSQAWTTDAESRLVTVGIKDNDVYVKGLSEDAPEAWIHGEISGDKVTFPSRQLIVDDNGNRYLYFNGGLFDQEDDYPKSVADGITMNINTKTGVISSPKAPTYKDAEYMIIAYAGEIYTDVQSLQIYNVTMTPADVTMKHYSMGGFMCPFKEEENWDAGFRVEAIYSNDGNDVWFSNLFPQYFIDQYNDVDKDFFYEAWVHGTINDGRIRIEKQMVLPDKELGFVAKTYGEEGYRDYIELIITEDGTLYMDDFVQDGEILDNENYIPSVAACLVKFTAEGEPELKADGSLKVADYAMGYKLVPVTDEQMSYPVIPTDVDMQDYTYAVTTWYDQKAEKTVTMGFDGTDVYVKGLSFMQDMYGDEAYPDIVFRGKMAADGKSFTLPSTQFCGIDNYFGVAYITFMMGMEYNWDTEEYDPIEGVKWEKRQDGSWEMAEDTNLTFLSLDGNLIDVVALATLTPDATGIETLYLEPETRNSKPETFIYNLQGQRLDKMQRGINIVGGKKVFVK